MLGLLATNLVTLNHGQVTKTIPELAPNSPNFHTKPTGGHLSLDIFNVHQPPLQRGLMGPETRWVFSGTRLELRTRQPRVLYLDHWLPLRYVEAQTNSRW
ncbi:hypothetical protein TNCV_2276451 [Trichonephila clavipes]|nr:hypothetical protein TNCV_2276451 [Trichonephila clavipes]